MTWLTESQARARAAGQSFGWGGFEFALAIKLLPQILRSHFDIFLSHSIKDAELVLGLKTLLEAAGKSIYVDWIDDPAMDRERISGETAEKLRVRMRQSESLLYVYSRHSQRSRWMPWELGYFDGFSGNVAILPIVPDHGSLDFQREEYLQIYPKVDFTGIAESPRIYVNRASELEQGDYLGFEAWLSASDKMRPGFAAKA